VLGATHPQFSSDHNVNINCLCLTGTYRSFVLINFFFSVNRQLFERINRNQHRPNVCLHNHPTADKSLIQQTIFITKTSSSTSTLTTVTKIQNLHRKNKLLFIQPNSSLSCTKLIWAILSVKRVKCYCQWKVHWQMRTFQAISKEQFTDSNCCETQLLYFQTDAQWTLHCVKHVTATNSMVAVTDWLTGSSVHGRPSFVTEPFH